MEDNDTELGLARELRESFRAEVSEDALCKELSASGSNLVRTVEEDGTRLANAERCIAGLIEELAKTNTRIERIDADRDAMRKAFDQRFAEIVQAYEDAETAFIERLERMAAHNLALSKHGANLKQELTKQIAADDADGSKG